MQNIKDNGLLQPIGVKVVKDRFILLYGFRRLTACKKLGWKNIPAVITDVENFSEVDFLIKNASENLHRKNVNMVEFGRICSLLQKEKLSMREIAVRLSVPLTRVENAITEFQRLPKKYRNKTMLFSLGRDKNNIGKVPSSMGARVLKFRRMNSFQKENLIDWALKENKTTTEVNILGSLLNEGMNLSDAKKKVDKIKVLTFKFPVNKEEFEKLNKSPIQIIRESVKKVYPQLLKY